MNVLVVCQYYYPEPFRLPDICQALMEEGHSVTVVTGTPNYPEGVVYPGYEKGARADEVLSGVRVHRCPTVPRKKGAFYRFLNYYSYVVSSWWYLRRCREEFDVVFVNQLSPVMMAQAGLSWAKRHGKKCVLYCLDLWPESLLLGGIRKGSALYRVFLGISRRIYRRADQVMVSSQGFLPYFEETLGMDSGKIRYLPQYAEELFGELPAVEKKADGVDFLFAGNVGNLQSVETIVEAARLLREDQEIRIHIVGGGISLEKCKELAKGLENITFYGRKKLEEMPQFYAMADALLISLIDDPGMSANLPGKLQSYLAAGKPVIASLNGETARLIREADCGLCSPAEDAQALAKILREAASREDERLRWGRNARNYYENHFRKESFIETLTQILLENCKE